VAVAGVGVFLTTRKKTSSSEVCTGPPGQQDCFERTVVTRPTNKLGLGVAAGAALVGVVDAFLTAHRARAARAEDGSGTHPGFLSPSIEPGDAGARLTLRFSL